MINLVEGNNSAFVTLRERSSIANAVFLMELIFSDNRQDKKILRVDDLSLENDRVNELSINVVDSVDNESLINGIVYLTPGRYQYRIFEVIEGLDPSTGNLLEIGILTFKKEIVKSKYSRQKQKKVYNG